jgi:hypothetical protein
MRDMALFTIGLYLVVNYDHMTQLLNLGHDTVTWDFLGMASYFAFLLPISMKVQSEVWLKFICHCTFQLLNLGHDTVIWDFPGMASYFAFLLPISMKVQSEAWLKFICHCKFQLS